MTHERHPDVAVRSHARGFEVDHAPHVKERRKRRDACVPNPRTEAERGAHIAYQTALLEAIAERLGIIV